MTHRPNVLAVMVLALGFTVGFVATFYGYGVPVALATITTLAAVQLSEDRRRAREKRIREALAICRFSISDAADKSGMDTGDFVRALSAERKLDDWRLEMLGDEFRRVLSLLELRDRGLPELARTALAIVPAILDVKRSA